jgi:hypothetical protein
MTLVPYTNVMDFNSIANWKEDKGCLIWYQLVKSSKGQFMEGLWKMRYWKYNKLEMLWR